MEWFLIWMLCAIFSAVIASSKRRSSGGWFVLGFLFGPFALISVGLMPALREETKPATPNATDLRKCPQCAEMIKREAKKCRYCGSEIEPMAPWDGVDRSTLTYRVGHALAEGFSEAQARADNSPASDLDTAVRDAYRPMNLLRWLIGVGVALYIVYWVHAFVTHNL